MPGTYAALITRKMGVCSVGINSTKSYTHIHTGNYHNNNCCDVGNCTQQMQMFETNGHLPPNS